METSRSTPQKPCIYARISLDRDATQLATDRQITECRELAQRKNWPDVPDEDVFRDESISASKKVPRPAYNKMMQAIEAGQYDSLLVYDLDRLTRKPMELEEFILLAESKNLQLANVSGDVDLSTSGGRMTARIKGAVAKQEAERIGERVKAAHKQRAQQGLPPKAMRLFGYDKDFNIVEDQAQAIRDAIEYILAGNSLLSAVKFFEPFPTVQKKTGRTTTGNWQYATVREIITRPFIAGISTLNGVEYGKGQWKAIIDEKTHLAIVEHLATKDSPRKGIYSTDKHLLSGIAICGLCGGKMYSHTTPAYKNRKPQSQYFCRKQYGGCGKIGRSEPKLDEYIGEVVKVALAETTPVDPVEEDYTDEIAEINATIEELAQLRTDKTLSTADWAKAVKEERSKLDALQKKQAEQVASNAAKKSVEGFDWDSATIKQKRSVLTQLVESIVVNPVKKGTGRTLDYSAIEIIWKE